MRTNPLNERARDYFIAIIFGVYGMYEMSGMGTQECRVWVANVMDNELNYDEYKELERIQRLSMENQQNVDILLTKLSSNLTFSSEKEYRRNRLNQIVSFGIHCSNDDVRLFLYMLKDLVHQRLSYPL